MEENIIKRDPKLMSPLQLAYIGDVVYELYVRSFLVETTDLNVNQLHKNAVKFVKAEAQAEVAKEIMDILSDEEVRIFKRGRNAKSGSIPKNAKLIDYKHATGFESLLGYLYILNRKERIDELFEIAKKFIKR
ncbi:ribonuclease-3 family protein [Dethiosulfatibacter aminovorans DSM 17477]|uniref:Mini-ribonuclease 3 n=1 Tax=Dethiosulfatibacter aminovorans DSM 17477 TaxID=1121476 RepID=A0A1M6KGA5_9FIRM|nr:ribonuclease III domain-containing protein [Dethiosulfatibacter aminovorans]SHJ57988.1 ribonuclease-3 family protein [Dethiosulfatibacter aminovorans DSM 17477]